LTAPGSEFEAVICRVDARGCEVAPADGGPRIFAPIRGKLHLSRRDARSPLAPGDRVLLGDDGGGPSIHRVLPRRSRLARESTSGGRPQVVAANVDLVVALLPAAEPAPSTRLADRMLCAASSENAEGTVLVSKADLVPETVVDDLVALYRGAGIRALAVSVEDGRGVEEAGAMLRGRTSVLAGPSGAGKTTLLKRLLGPVAADLTTGAVNRKTGKGRHTTTASRLLPFPGGGWVVDTPGVRSLALPEMRPADLALLFPDIARCGACRFADCSHLVEPGCAVKAAADAGALDRRRLDSYGAMILTMREESARRAW
jgi:ribosome biogenesis GTPase